MHADQLKSPARWNVVSMCAPFLGFLLGCVAGAAYGGHPVSVAVVGLRTYGIVSVIGFLSGAIALVRRERWVGLAIAALLLNAIGVAMGVYAFVDMFVWNPPPWSN
jgi:hypothetical protein